MRRNYDSASNAAAGDKANSSHVKKMQAEYEAQLSVLKTEIVSVKEELMKSREETVTQKHTIDASNITIDTQKKEIERLTKELKLAEKKAEDRLSGMRQQTSGLYEQVNKLKKDNSGLKKEVDSKQVQIDELTTKLELMGNADATMIDLKQRLKERDGIILTLRNQLDDSIVENETLMRRVEEANREVETLNETFNSQNLIIEE